MFVLVFDCDGYFNVTVNGTIRSSALSDMDVNARACALGFTHWHFVGHPPTMRLSFNFSMLIICFIVFSVN